MSDQGQEPDLLIGRTIGGKYRVDAFVGGGGMGKVYKAHHLGLQKAIAIKVLHSTFNADPKFGQRFQREALAASKLDHPNVLQVIDFGQDTDGLFYIAMEFIAGKGLDQLINEEGIPPIERTIDILSQVCAALAVAHEHGILHRDMKPENVMLIQRRDDEGHVVDLVKVCDFGIAKIGDARGDDEGKQKTAALTAQGTVVGTPEYMSPEQARGEKLDARADIYAVGVILYQMCTGVIPFYAESAVGVLMRRLTEEVKPPHDVRPDVDPRVEAVILKAMHRDKTQRHQTIRELRADLRSLRGARGSMLPGEIAASGPIYTPETNAPTMAVATPASTPSIPGQKATRIGEIDAPVPGPSTPIAIPKQKKSPARWFVAAGALVVVLGVGGFVLTQSNAALDPPVAALAPPVTASAEPTSTSVPAPVPVPVPVTAAPAPETAAEDPDTDDPGPRRRPRDRETAAPATVAPATAAPVIATAAPATAAPPPVTSRPATAAAPTGPLEARAAITGLSVDGGLTSNVVRSGIDRVVSRFESCYADAARRASRNAAGTVNVRITLDEGGRATGVSARGDPLPGLSSCVRGVAQRISTRAPDTGTVDASFGVQFSPRGR